MGCGRTAAPDNSEIRVTTSFQGQMATANILQTNAEPAQGGISSKTILILALIGGAAAAGAAVALGKGKSSITASTTVHRNYGCGDQPG
jgi:hypothetical protein